MALPGGSEEEIGSAEAFYELPDEEACSELDVSFSSVSSSTG